MGVEMLITVILRWKGHITPENYNESNCGIELLMQIIVWAPSIGSIPIYDYSLGLSVQPPLYI